MRTLKELNIFFEENPSCEHCGSLEQYDATYNDGDTNWCMDCTSTFDEEEKPTNLEFKMIKKEECERKIKYFESQINNLKTKLISFS